MKKKYGNIKTSNNESNLKGKNSAGGIWLPDLDYTTNLQKSKQDSSGPKKEKIEIQINETG